MKAKTMDRHQRQVITIATGRPSSRIAKLAYANLARQAARRALLATLVALLVSGDP